ncbi:hypothetical protein BGZ74_002726 [Mortierella antarctica]|nr:hypothetical protein BGZ74_002726 [Mortierella antarctica]
MNAQHIRALTCYASHSLQILRASNYVNLVEINYLVDVGNPVELSAGLENLAELIALNLQLTAVSIEGINLDAEETRDKLSRFLDFLDEFPRITSVCFDPGVKIKDSELRRERRDTVGGRWESEYRHLSIRGNNNMTVMEHNGHLVLVVPRSISWSEYTAAMARFQGIQRLTIDTLCIGVTIFLDPAKRLFPDLTSLDIRNYLSDQEPVDSSLDNLSGLMSLSLDLQMSSEPDWNIMSRHYSVMTSLNLSAVPLGQFYGIVSGCPVLQELTSWLLLEESAPVACPQWICSLRKFHLRIVCDVNMDYSDTEDEIAVKIDQGKQFAERVMPPFMRQLGSQTLLKDLKLSFHSEERPDVSPFLELSLDASSGLPILSSLRELRSVAFSGLQHSTGKEEIEWMKRHWPRLHSLEVPIMQEPPYIGDTVVEWRDT